MGKNQLTLLVFLIFDEYLNSVANLDVGIVAEFAERNDAIALVSDVNHSFALVECDDGTFDYILVFDGVERFVISLGEFFARLLTVGFAFLVGVPVEIFDGGIFKFGH